jgi:NAD(P)-dependent dehydrogenase (short-subunit alcohol dehydrogenase family)
MNAARRSAGPALLSCRLLEGKVAIVTWARSGIGAAAARAFTAAGATVVLAAPGGGELEAIAAQVADSGGDALVVPADLGDPVAAEWLVHRTVEAFGRLDAAFNNTGPRHVPTPLADLAVATFDKAVRVNTRSIFLLMKHQIQAMLAGGGGAIVNMPAGAGLAGEPGMDACAVDKHAIAGLTETAALDYRQRGIRVNAISPGIGRAEEVAAAAVWLCSDQASYVSGATIPVGSR